MRSGFVAGETLLHQIIDCLLISTALHVDEITYDQTSNIAQPKLAGDFIRRLQVCLRNRFLYIASALVPAGIHINRYQRFGLVDHNVSATLQPYLPVQSVVSLLLNAISLKNRRATIVKVESIPRARGSLCNH